MREPAAVSSRVRISDCRPSETIVIPRRSRAGWRRGNAGVVNDPRQLAGAAVDDRRLLPITVTPAAADELKITLLALQDYT